MKQNQKKRSKNENTTHVKQTRTENSDIRNCRVINKDRCQGPEGTNRPKLSCSVPTEIHSLCPWAWGVHFSHVLGVFTPRPISSPLVDWASCLYIRPGSSLPVQWSPDNWQNLLVPAAMPTLMHRGWQPSSQGTTCPRVARISSLALLM